MKFFYKTSENRLSPFIALGNDHSCHSMQLLQAMNSVQTTDERNANGL